MPLAAVSRPESVAHAHERASSTCLVEPRAKRIGPTSRPSPASPRHERSGLALRTTLAATGTSQRCAAQWLGVDERRVREKVLGEDPLTLTQIFALPPSVSVGIAAAIVADARARSLVPLDVDGEVGT